MEKKSEKSILNNTKWIIFHNIASSVISLFLTAIMSRYLGPSNWGKLSYAMSIISIFSSFTSLGIDSILIAEIVYNRSQEGTIVGTSLALKCCASIIGFLGLIIFVVNTSSKELVVSIIIVIQGVSILFQGYQILNEWFLANLYSKYYVISSLIGAISSAVLKIYLVWKNANIFYFAMAITFESIVTCIICSTFFFRIVKFKLKVNCKVAWNILKKSWYFIISNMAIIIYTQIDKIMINNMINDYTVGVYSAGSTIANLWIFIPNAYINSYKSKILGMWSNDENEAKLELRILKRKAILMCVGIAVCLSAFGKIIIYILYGENYVESYGVLIILTWASVFAIYGTIGTIWILGEGVNKYSSARTVIGGIINLLIDFWAIPRFGMYGAALGTLISQIFAAYISMFFWKKTRAFNAIIKKR